MALGADWVGVRGELPDLRFVTGDAGRVQRADDFAGYDVVVLQQVRGAAWVELIRRLQAQGTTVLYEIDDDLAVRAQGGRPRGARADRPRVGARRASWPCASATASSAPRRSSRAATPGIATRTWVCRNGLDLPRYAAHPPRARPRRDRLGRRAPATSARSSAWLPAVRDVTARPAGDPLRLDRRPATPTSSPRSSGAERCLSIPFGLLETYPAAMTNLDIALAPAGASNFFRAKSDLRWLEASALGIPVVADPVVYPDVEHGVTGFHAATPGEARTALLALVDDAALRARVGAAAQDVVRATRRIEVAAEAWREALCEAAYGDATLAASASSASVA